MELNLKDYEWYTISINELKNIKNGNIEHHLKYNMKNAYGFESSEDIKVMFETEYCNFYVDIDAGFKEWTTEATYEDPEDGEKKLIYLDYDVVLIDYYDEATPEEIELYKTLITPSVIVEFLHKEYGIIL